MATLFFREKAFWQFARGTRLGEQELDAGQGDPHLLGDRNQTVADIDQPGQQAEGAGGAEGGGEIEGLEDPARRGQPLRAVGVGLRPRTGGGESAEQREAADLGDPAGQV